MVAAEALAMDPGMLPASTRLRRKFVLESLRAPYVEFLEDRLLRDPRDLRAHVERILQRIAQADAAGCFAALVDLFVVVGPRGRALRARLLRAADACLNAGQSAWLAARLDASLSPGEAAATGSLTLRVAGDGRAAGSVILALATQARERGDQRGAQLLLEEALSADPADELCCAALLELYGRGGLRQDFECMRTRLLGRRAALPELWTDTAARLGAMPGPCGRQAR